MSGGATYLARRAAQKERVRILYRRALKDTLNWAVHRHIFYQDASDLRDKFEANKHLGFNDLFMQFYEFSMPCPLDRRSDAIDRLIADGEANHNKFRHPDPYIGELRS
ncbi:hypothetical protein Syun_015579 [Stephania yunnanensis]|uniref:NADH dehydrogenase [ubiquinone] 1 beta subcomplex subunit 9 n=1 Tax=Stephania yunnanensis TaxID=152371 RepID=A0AAP0JLY6_9MAGN